MRPCTWPPSAATRKSHDLLLAHVAEINATDDRRLTPQHGAAPHGQVPIIRWLLDHGAAVDRFSLSGGSPRHMAAWEGHDAAVRFLLRTGATIMLTTRDGQNAAEIARERGHVALAALLTEFLKSENNPPAWMDGH